MWVGEIVNCSKFELGHRRGTTVGLHARPRPV